jgi:hypothetical protein
MPLFVVKIASRDFVAVDVAYDVHASGSQRDEPMILLLVHVAWLDFQLDEATLAEAVFENRLDPALILFPRVTRTWRTKPVEQRVGDVRIGRQLGADDITE